MLGGIFCTLADHVSYSQYNIYICFSFCCIATVAGRRASTFFRYVHVHDVWKHGDILVVVLLRMGGSPA